MKDFIPNFTQIPNLFLDKVMQDLNEGELRVMLYVMRRVYGFQKKKDRISFSQMSEGVESADGYTLDLGTGMQRRAVIRSVNTLVDKKLLIKTESAKGNIYEINVNYKTASSDLKTPVENGEVVTERHQSSDRKTPEVVTERHPQKKEKESKQNKEFNYQEKLDYLLNSSDPQNRIVGEYLSYKKINISSKEEWKKHDANLFANAKILTAVKPVYKLEYYRYMFQQADKMYPSWTLNAIAKNHQEIMRQLTK